MSVKRWSAWVFAALAFGSLLFFVMWAWRFHAAYDWSWDETVIILTGREVARGVSLYDPMWWNYPPLLFWELGALFRLFGEDVMVARALAVAWSTLTLLATILLAERLRGWRTAALAAFLLLGTPIFIRDSRAVLADMPVAACGLWALWVLMRWPHRREAALVAGALLGAALMTKPTALPFGVGLVVLAWGTRNGRWQRLMTLALGALGVVGLVLVNVPLRAFLEQVLLFNAGAGGDANPAANLLKIWAIVTGEHLWRMLLIPVASVGVGFAALGAPRQRHAVLALTATLAAFVLMFAPYPDLFSHLVLVLVPPAIVLFALGLTYLFERLPLRQAWQAPVWAGLLIGVALLDGTPFFWQAYQVGDLDDKRRDAMEYAARWRAELPPGTTIVSDDPMFVFLSGHSPPPPLVNLSKRRWLRNGEIDTQPLIALLAQERPDYVVFWTDRLREMPGVLEWVQSAGYELQATHAHGKRRIYTRAEGYVPLSLSLSDTITLRGYAIQGDETLWVRLLVETAEPWQAGTGMVVRLEADGVTHAETEFLITPPGDVLPGDAFPVFVALEHVGDVDLAKAWLRVQLVSSEGRALQSFTVPLAFADEAS